MDTKNFDKIVNDFNDISKDFTTIIITLGSFLLRNESNFFFFSLLINSISFLISYISHFILIKLDPKRPDDTTTTNLEAKISKISTNIIFVMILISMILFILGLLSLISVSIKIK